MGWLVLALILACFASVSFAVCLWAEAMDARDDLRLARAELELAECRYDRLYRTIVRKAGDQERPSVSDPMVKGNR